MSDQDSSSSDRLRRMASDYEDAVSGSRSEQIAARALARARSRRAIVGRRLVVLASGMAILALSLVAVGSTVTRSLPGDPLYGINRAYQDIGARFGVIDPVERRLHEFIGLVERGDHARASELAAEVLADLEETRGVKVSLPEPDTESEDAGTETSTESEPVTAEATAEGTPPDPVATVKLAAEMLRSELDGDGGDLESAASDFAVAAAALTTEEPVAAVGATTTTTTTLVEGTTTTSTTDPRNTGSTTTTTIPGSTTTTTNAGSGDDPGPIFLPPVP